MKPDDLLPPIAPPSALFVTRTVAAAGRSWLLTLVENQDALLHAVQTDEQLANFPYGLMLWPSALGLAGYLAENPALVKQKHVLEIGAGVGLAGLSARTLQPASLVQTDYQADALLLAQRNARQNGWEDITVRQGDWRNWPADLTDFDIVIGSDILYERSLHDDLARLFPRLLAPHGQIVLSDPLRPQSLTFVERLEKSGLWRVHMEGRRVVWNPVPEQTETKHIAVFTLQPAQ